MVGHSVSFSIDKKESVPGERILKVRNLVMQNKIHKELDIVNDVSFDVRRGEIVCIAGIDGNGQSDLVYGITGLEKIKNGKVFLNNVDITNKSIFERNNLGLSHIPEDRHKHGLVLDYSLGYNSVLENYWSPDFTKYKFLINEQAISKHAKKLIDTYDIRSGRGADTTVRSMSGGNQQKVIVAREIDRDPDLLIAVQPTRGLDVGAIEFIHKQIVKERDKNKAVLLVSYELDEVFNLADRILVMFNGKIVGEFKPKDVTREELGLYMAGAKSNYNFVDDENEEVANNEKD